MYNPQTKGTRDYSESIEEFRGLDLNERISSGYLAWTRNCSSRRYPTVSARRERGLVDGYDIQAMIALGGVLYYIENGDLYVHYKGFDKSEDIQIADVGHDQDLPFSLVAMGSYVIAFPKGVYFDTTIDPREHEPVP